MTQEDKQLLLKDLCARLPYRVKARFCDGVKEEIDDVWDIDMFSGAINADYIIDDVKPYLRPMSSMTEEERLYFHRNSARVYVLVDEEKIITKPFYGYTIRLFDWLNAHHFDYHGLIERGLALEAPEGMYKAE